MLHHALGAAEDDGVEEAGAARHQERRIARLHAPRGAPRARGDLETVTLRGRREDGLGFLREIVGVGDDLVDPIARHRRVVPVARQHDDLGRIRLDVEAFEVRAEPRRDAAGDFDGAVARRPAADGDKNRFRGHVFLLFGAAIGPSELSRSGSRRAAAERSA